MSNKPMSAGQAFGALLGVVVGGVLFAKVLIASDEPPRAAPMRASVAPVAPVPVLQPSKPREIEYTITAPQLLAEYVSNEVRADAKFKGLFVQVRGYADTIGKDITGDTYVTLRTGQYEFRQIQCFVDNPATVVNLSKGNWIRAEGVIVGMFGNVVLKDCTAKLAPRE